MKKKGFFTKLRDEGKLQLVEPSPDLADAYRKKSESFLASAKLLLENERLEEAVSLTYYSMYYMVLALFFRVGIKCENHSASVILLEKIFDIDKEEISSAKKERVDKQYYVDVHVFEAEAGFMIERAEGFNSRIFEFVERLNSEDIEGFRKKMGDVLGVNG